MTDPSVVSAEERSKNRLLLTSLFVGHLTNDWVYGTIWLIAPAIAASMGLGPTEVGLILAINGVSGALLYIPAGIAADRSSRPGLLLFITFWWVAAGFFCATLAPGFWGVTLLLAFGVMGDAFWHPVATGVLVKSFPKQRAHALGIHAMGGSIGAEVLGPLSAGFLLGFFDWRTSLQILTLPAVVVGILFIPLIHRLGSETIRRRKNINLRKLALHWKRTTGLQLMALMVFYNMSLYALISMIPLSLQNTHGQSSWISGIIFAAILLAGTAFQPMTGRLSDQVGRRAVILTLLMIGWLACFLVFISGDLTWFIGSTLIAAGVLTAVRPAILAAAVDYSGESEATTLGIVFTVLDGVGALGALFAGLLGEIELSFAFALAGVFGMVATFLAFIMPLQPGVPR